MSLRGSTRRTLVAFLFVSLTIVLGFGRSVEWPVESSELKPDPGVLWGELENGLRYALYARDAKPGIVSMRFVVEVGSLDEKESERGLAHFVEHMAFEGTRNYQPGELVAFFQRLGMSYGGDVNAFTYPDKTVYHLELPQNEIDLIEDSLNLYRDYADGILFDSDRMDTERRVIAREKQVRGSPSALIQNESFSFAFDGTMIGKRNPIGLQSVVENVTREELLAFYEKWYRPDLMTVVIVGDFEATAIEERIEKTFGDLERAKAKLPKRKIGRLSRHRPFRSKSYYLEGVDRQVLEIWRSWMEPNKDSLPGRRRETLRSFATSLFDERCRRLIDGMGGDFALYDRFLGIPFCRLSISYSSDDMTEGFALMDRMLRQALDYGFTRDELAFLKRNWLQMSKAGESKFRSAEPRLLIDDLVEHVVAGKVYLSAPDYREYVDTFVKNTTLDEVNRTFREIWKLKDMTYFVVSSSSDELGRAELKKELRRNRKFMLPLYQSELPQEFEYTDLGKRGDVIEVSEIESVGAKTYRFANNTRLTFLRTENESDMVRALVRIGGGMLAFEDWNPSTHALAMQSLFRSGFGDYRIEEVYSELRNSVLSFMFGVEDHDAFTYRVVAPADGLDEFLKIVAEFLLDPEVDKAAFDMAQSKLRQSRKMEADGMNEGYRDLYRMLYPGEPRFHSPSIDDIEAAELDVVKGWLEPSFKEGFLEVVVVGDISERQVIEIMEESLGALPDRRSEKPDYTNVRSLKVDSVSGKHRIEYQKGKGDNAATVVVWTIQEDISFRESAALHILSALLEERLRRTLREDMGMAYAPQVNYESFPAYDTLRHIRADVDCLKNDADRLMDVIVNIGFDLSENPVSQSELQAAVAPLEESIRQAWNDNRYLIENVLYGVHEYPRIVENALQYKNGILSTITPEEVLQVAERYLARDEPLAVAIVPAQKIDIAVAPDSVVLPPKAGVAR